MGFHQVRQVVLELKHSDRQTDRQTDRHDMTCFVSCTSPKESKKRAGCWGGGGCGEVRSFKHTKKQYNYPPPHSLFSHSTANICPKAWTDYLFMERECCACDVGNKYLFIFRRFKGCVGASEGGATLQLCYLNNRERRYIYRNTEARSRNQ
jgi:hypothetical protein